MNIHATLRRAIATLGLLSLLPAVEVVAQDEPSTFNAFAVVHGSGSSARSGNKNAMMVATFDGAFFVETDDGPVHAGQVACLASVKVDAESTRQTATGVCTFNAADGSVSWGEFDCNGLNLIGCRGTFKLTGGTGRFAGATGESVLIWRPSSSELKAQLEGTALAKTSGIVIWRDFKLKDRPAETK